MLVQVNVKVAYRADGSVRWVEVCRFGTLPALLPLLDSLSGGRHADLQIRVFNDRGMDDNVSEACRPNSRNRELAG